ncbi:hypothetical protein BDN72DRAFT_830113 [Pluteus cervinus]|uniref:Uncharacterized protein n=1 Tax=Pluteus cervinus TaxID=181527 RepID=A0ACD3BGC3_9AGAR|nr:hypothetical protein BDN72DRAFT_830113 [Pluteus cervinus]
MAAANPESTHPNTAPSTDAQDTVMDPPLAPPSSHNDPQSLAHSESVPKKSPTTMTPIKIYTRPQILALYKSPLVHPPPNMPELKDWFGTEIEQAPPKKDAELTTANNSRNNRYRREAEDGDPSSKASFRPSLTQQSQMGNFKHQSLRSNERDRDRDRDGDKDRERDMRDREGQERLRNLSDKYDRDRLSHPLPLRGKDRDAAPHLSTASGNRHPSGQGSNAPAGRPNAREPQKKKAGETSEDWRRGAEPPRPGKEERSDPARKDRDDRERPRSRARESSRTRRDPSNPRRDREDRDRDRERRGDRARDDTRRDRDDPRRDADGDDDPRRWRDDGKRDERIAARRERERPRDREGAWDVSDRRWTPGEERSKRARDRKPGAGDDREREDRREPQREREPAWMDTYVPSASAGILGAKTSDGELDGIQAWKKGMKEREQKDKTTPTKDRADSELSLAPQAEPAEKLDEIQLFKLLMKREEEKKRTDGSEATSQGISGTSSPRGDPTAKKDVLEMFSALTTNEVKHENQIAKRSIQPSPANDVPLPPQNQNRPQQEPVSNDGLDGSKTSRLFPNPVNNAEKVDSAPNPPPGSRLLAFGRIGPSASVSPNANDPRTSQDRTNLPSPAPDFNPSVRPDARTTPGFTPFEEAKRQQYLMDDPRLAERAFHANGDNAVFLDPSLGYDAGNAGFAGNKGSRFAKFFVEGKNKESSPPMNKSQPPIGAPPNGPSPIQRHEQAGFRNVSSNSNDPRSMEDIFAMLNNSVQGQRVVQPLSNHPAVLSHPSQPNLHIPPSQGPLPSHPTSQHFHPQQLHNAARMEALYESRPEDRNFVPDGMVPGLRPAPPRSRDGVGLYHETLEDLILLNSQQRLPPQHRNLDPGFPGPSPVVFAQQANRVNNIPIQQTHFRGGPSPINQQVPLQNPQQRLPPGLANLGGRPPHEPAQYLGVPGLPNGGLPTNLLPNGNPQQHNYNNFPNNNLGFGGAPQLRPPLPGGHLPNAPNPLGLGGLNHPGNVDLRNANPQSHLLGLGNVNPNLMRGPFPPQAGSAPQMQNALAGLRQQQQQQLHPHMVPHLPPHYQQQQSINNASNQPAAHELMALLMGGPHRE